MKRFNETFRTKLYDTIKETEDNSLVEIVVLIKPQSGSYRDIAAWTGIIFSFILYSFFMLSPFNFDVFLIYGFTVLSFFAIYFLVMTFPQLIFSIIPTKRKDRNVEIMARALFQKGDLRFTSQRIGTLIYFSLYEKKAFILPDRGAETAVPAQEWEKINENFQGVFKSSNLPEAILSALAQCKSVFHEYIPPVENDINELPDDLNVEL
jgi:putative membrane protein